MRGTPPTVRGALIGLAAVCLLALAGYRLWLQAPDDSGVATLALLVPDDATAAAPLVAIWREAAREEGLNMEVVAVRDLVRPVLAGRPRRYAGLIMPDGVHQSASAPLVEYLSRFVREGGWMMLVYDAATHTDSGAWYPRRAPLSPLLGIDYGLYEGLRERVVERGPILLSADAQRTLSIPPGKTLAFAPANPADEPRQAICGYSYGALEYPVLVTQGRFSGKTLALTPSGSLVAGVATAGRGGVLFVNLPLGFLKGRTDGLPLHAFLRYFAVDLLHLPTLMAVPEGIGGLVFNWHVDSGAAIEPISELDSLGLLSQGPFSIHFTAGPDTYRIGDGAGLHLLDNRELAPWIARFKQRGDALGSHGGWIHNYFGETVSETNREQMQPFLELNDAAVRAVSGAAVREYSAPVGNQPLWVTDWLEAHGYLAYYFTGNSGMSPTRSFRDGELHARRIWSFPIAILGSVASFEEASDIAVTPEEMSRWLVGMTDFVARTGTVRTFYSHPTGWRRYLPAIRQWFERTLALSQAGEFHWYTMTRIAEFLDRREQVQWSATGSGQVVRFAAIHPESLEQMTWSLPRSAFGKPVIEAGSAQVAQTADAWRVIAGRGRELRFVSHETMQGIP